VTVALGGVGCDLGKCGIGLDRGDIAVAEDPARDRRQDANPRPELEIAVARPERRQQHLCLRQLVAPVVQLVENRPRPPGINRDRDAVHADAPGPAEKAVLDDEALQKSRGEDAPHRERNSSGEPPGSP
jgi:hypothetical protein